MKLSLVKDGLFDPRELEAFRKEKYEQIHAGVARGFKQGGDAIAPVLRAHMGAVMNIKRKAFTAVMRAKVYAQKKDRLPVMDLGATKPGWLGMFEHGGTIKGPLLIPLLETRLGYAKFKQIVATIVRSGSGFFKKMDDGRVILFAEYQPEYGKPLARFRRAERARRGGGRIKAGEDIPIAILVPQVTIRKRLRVFEIVESKLGVIVDAVEQEISRGA